MTKQKQKGLVRNGCFALAIMKCNKKNVSLTFIEILACFDYSGTRIRQQNFSVCLTKNLVDFLVNYQLAHSEIRRLTLNTAKS